MFWALPSEICLEIALTVSPQDAVEARLVCSHLARSLRPLLRRCCCDNKDGGGGGGGGDALCGTAAGATAARGGIARAHVLRWLGGAVGPNISAETAVRAWQGAASDAHDYDNRLFYNEAARRVRIALKSQDWSKCPLTYWAALIAVLRMDIRLFTILRNGNDAHFDAKTCVPAVRQLGAKLSAAIVEAYALAGANENPEVNPPDAAAAAGDSSNSSSSSRKFSCSAMLAILDDVAAVAAVEAVCAARGRACSLRHDALFHFGLQSGSLAVVDWALARSPDVAASYDNFAVVWAAQNNRPTLLARILAASARVQPSIFGNQALHTAARHGYLEVVQTLMADPRLRLDGESHNPLIAALAGGQTAVIAYLVSAMRGSDIVTSTPNAPLRAAAGLGNLEVVRLLMAVPEVSRLAETNRAAVMEAAYRGHFHVVKWFVEHYEPAGSTDATRSIRTRALLSAILCAASKGGHHHIVQYALNNPLADPTSSFQGSRPPIESAAEAGHLLVVAALLRHPAVDPSANNSAVLRIAASRNRLEVVRMLVESAVAEQLKAGEVAPSSRQNRGVVDVSVGLIAAAQAGHIRVFEYLASLPGADASRENNAAVREACRRGSTDIVRLLLSRDEVDPSVSDWEALKAAAKSGSTEVVRMLLEKASLKEGGKTSDGGRVWTMEKAVLIETRQLAGDIVRETIDVFLNTQ
ncbi:ankyrin repeat-containing domain protein [Zopfochytrium polystomum]|nr:ankyrin repeat-containing domain protein [Zopfochytrium polystomum]